MKKFMLLSVIAICSIFASLSVVAASLSQTYKDKAGVNMEDESDLEVEDIEEEGEVVE